VCLLAAAESRIKLLRPQLVFSSNILQAIIELYLGLFVGIRHLRLQESNSLSALLTDGLDPFNQLVLFLLDLMFDSINLRLESGIS